MPSFGFSDVLSKASCRFGVGVLHHLNNVAVWWHAIGTFSLVVAILAKAPKLQSGHFVFKTFVDGTGGWAERASPAYVAVTGVSLPAFSLFRLLIIFL